MSERHLVLTPAEFAAGYTVREPYDDGVTWVRREYQKLWELPDKRVVVRKPKEAKG